MVQCPLVIGYIVYCILVHWQSAISTYDDYINTNISHKVMKSTVFDVHTRSGLAYRVPVVLTRFPVVINMYNPYFNNN